MTRLHDQYKNTVKPALIKEFGYVNPMQAPRLDKIVLNMGVGEGVTDRKKVEAAAKELALISGQKAVITKAKKSIATYKLRDGMTIGCKVTLRGENAHRVLKNALWVRENRLPAYCFSAAGGLNFGIPDYTGFADEKYDPDIGIFGLDVAVAFERPGFRISRRKVARRKVGPRHRLTREECQEFMQQNFKLEVVT